MDITMGMDRYLSQCIARLVFLFMSINSMIMFMVTSFIVTLWY